MSSPLLSRAPFLLALVALLAGAAAGAEAHAQAPAPQAQRQASVPEDYVIGVEDLLAVVFWREQDRALNTEVVVRPDGKISVPMLNDIRAAGLTPEQLAASINQAAAKYIRDASSTVIVRQIHSRKVFVIGEVVKPGTVEIGGELNVLQAIAQAGGFLEHANKSDVVVVRTVAGREQRFKFNYKDVTRGKSPEQNIRLKPGDTVLIR
jgi:polysaccharide export outer membrane protein